MRQNKDIGQVEVDPPAASSHDPARQFRTESPEEYLRVNIELKKAAYEQAATSLSTETALDVTAIILGINTFATSSSNFEVNMSAALLGAAVFSYFSVRYERDNEYEEYVTARAIEIVAIEDNGIDAEDLLPIFIMSFDRTPDTEERWFEKLEHYKPKAKIGPIPSNFVELIEEKKDLIREQDKAEQKIVQQGSSLLRNLRDDFMRAGRSLRSEWPETKNSFLSSGKIIANMLAQPRDTLNIISGQTWLEQKEKNRFFHASVIALVEQDGERSLKRQAAIKERPLNKVFSETYLGLRRAQGEQINGVRTNQRQQLFTGLGVIAATTFIAVNSGLALSSANNLIQSTISDGVNLRSILVGGASTVGFGGLAYMNIPPARTLYDSLIKLKERFRESAASVMMSHENVRRHLSKMVEDAAKSETQPPANNP